ncbi:CZB domain-containing protein [Magnetofaba australis]|uniref:Chemoreceptor zinc-binding domain-containing protein n=1 Tax=Magnetofaba australis IT-1 TaxID=1434232 RepID=A0A1Y2K2F0_9PROT|nr:CZB domain-containing protein [Magnetofaba australis]OSM02208.1 hypothetical protein MAIT1_02312 [Magnetofaba australis IT-1]
MTTFGSFAHRIDDCDGLDLRHARLLHLGWEMSLDNALESAQGAPDWPSAGQCALGQWLQADGLRKYQNFPDILRIQELHTDFHNVADSCHRAAQHGDGAIFTVQRSQLRRHSREILYLITLLELEYRRSLIPEASKFSPMEILKQLFAAGRESGRQDPLHARLQLNLSNARLLHLLWVQEEMEMALHMHAAPGSAQSQNTCELGDWIARVGLPDYGDLEPMQKLQTVHHAFHEQAASSLDALRNRRFQNSREAYGRMLELSREVIYLLTHVEWLLGLEQLAGEEITNP